MRLVEQRSVTWAILRYRKVTVRLTWADNCGGRTKGGADLPPTAVAALVLFVVERYEYFTLPTLPDP